MVLVSVKSIQGRRDYMEDRYAYIEKHGIIIAMICDGHGGFQVASETVKYLPHLILDELLKTSGTNVEHAKAIRKVIIEWGNKLKRYHSGSTLTGIAVKNGTLYIYNLGDSKTCLTLKPGAFVYWLVSIFDYKGEYMEKIDIRYSIKEFFCTPNHDADSEYERIRVNASNGKISSNRLNGILSVTRALGDQDVGPGLSNVPDIFWLKRYMAGEILMYSDGIYEPQRYQDTANFSEKYLYEIATRFNSDILVNYAVKHNSEDNLTAMIVRI
jgi:serine/threonine protein phosphatase PrpC